MTITLKKVIEKDKKKIIEDEIEHAKWEAEMVKKLGNKWFEIRDKWLSEALREDQKLLKDPKIRESLIKAILAKNHDDLQ